MSRLTVCAEGQKMRSPPEVDGVIDEDAWQAAEVADNFQQGEPGTTPGVLPGVAQPDPESENTWIHVLKRTILQQRALSATFLSKQIVGEPRASSDLPGLSIPAPVCNNSIGLPEGHGGVGTKVGTGKRTASERDMRTAEMRGLTAKCAFAGSCRGFAASAFAEKGCRSGETRTHIARR